MGPRVPGVSRHPGVENALRWLTPNPNLPDDLKVVSEAVHEAALELVEDIQTDSPELTSGLNLLVQAKDHLVRAKIIDKDARKQKPGYCEMCGEKLPEGEENFRYHGFSGNCPTKEEK